MRLNGQDVMTGTLSTRSYYRRVMFPMARARMAMSVRGRGRVGGIAAPPSYGQVSLQFGSLESFGEA